ncbi:TIP120-domain-containing protein [Lentinus tigrinus ALCF2SS1-6]|uniref:TIP120-domain-containing protein n=1 Tax=Lentinus tigrinus ALCF2SS1-6 TaxID=1328759 RepID=A0A5C2S8A4_9APHY|nr:TIP120-domain-containing protein [Lentinus tigrinus ALCF2SS1-6]
MTKTYIMNGLVEKMQSPDQDFRYMGLNDLLLEIKQDPNSFLGDEATENKVLKQVLTLVEDKISEVKNQAVKCLGQLIKIIRESQMEFVVDKLIEFSAGKDEELRDISGLALKTITSELPPEGKIATKACEKLTPKLLAQAANPDTPPETLIETLAILSILITRFPAYLANVEPQPVPTLTPLLTHSRPAVRKRAITTLAQFLPHAQPQDTGTLLNAVVLPGLAPSASIDKQRTVVQLVAAIARHSPHQIAPTVGDIIPSLLKDVQREDEELVESCLQALEALVLKCPTEITPSLSSIIQVGNQYIKHDPNYAGGDDDEDEEMADEEDEDEDLGDEYSDDEDTSYKTRRAATKLLASVIATRPELLTTLYKSVSPVLISRFGDREETVRVEVWSTYAILLNQTGVYGGSPQSNTEHTVGGKRKREEGMDVEETPYSLLQSQVPSLAKALLGQMKSPKTPSTTLETGFSLLHKLLTVLPGSLANQSAQIIASAKSVLSSSSRASSASLQVTCMSFLALFFAKHAPPVYSGQLDSITPLLLQALAEKHPRIASEAFRNFSSLLNAMQPVKSGAWVDRVYDEAVKRLSNHDTDAEVRACAEDCIGDLWISATDIMKTKNRKEWEYICRTTGRTDGAVKVVTRVATNVEIGDEWVNGGIEWVTVLLKKSGRVGKVEVFNCLDALLKGYSAIPSDLPANLIPTLKPYLTSSDIALLGAALDIVALLLELSPKSTFPEVERDILPDVYTIAHSPLVAGAPFESLLSFFAALVEADMQIATHVVPNLVSCVEKAPKAEASLTNVAKCIGQVVLAQRAVAAGTIAEFARHLKPSSKAKTHQVVLSLLVMGEVGRFIDMSPQQDIFNQAIDRFTAEQEEVRTAAAFAAGNMAVGNLHHFLPLIVKMVEHDQSKRLLALHAIKEIVTHCSHGQLEIAADMLWTPLFENSENQEETTRNVAAACLGKLTTTHPGRYLPQLHARINDPNPATRATVLTAIRYTFAENAASFDEILGGVIMDFLSLLSDADLTVRRLALSALNSAARSRAHLIRDHLPTLLPSLYKETVVNPDLIRTVQMGPWTHKVDDGLEARKTAYETLYTLLDNCLPKLELHEFLGRVAAGLADDSDEVKVICHMMLFRLAQVAPTAVAQRLDDLTPPLEKSMNGPAVTKDTVKQDLERAAELQRSTLRAVAALSKISQSGASPKFDAFVAATSKSPQWGAEFRELVGA